MKFYWFERDAQTDESLKSRADNLEAHGFDGIMYPYGPTMGDYFTRISRIINPESNFRYICSIRTYNMSAQYLAMICSSINSISNNKVGVNLLTGYINESEKSFGGILTEVNDYSSNVKRSNYMLNYAKEFKKISNADFFVSTTNKIVFDSCTENDLPILIPYLRSKEDWFKINNQKILVMIAPVIGPENLAEEYECDNSNECRHPKGEKCMNLDFFTKDTFFNFLDECKNNKIYGILFQESDYSREQYSNILLNIKEYKAKYT